MRQPPAMRYRLSDGMDDKADFISLSNGMFALLENLMVQRSSVEKRNGYTKHYTTALNGGTAVQRVFQHTDNSQTNTYIYMIGGKLYKDDGTTQTDLTNGLSFATGQDVHSQFLTFDGQLYGTDQTGRVFNSRDLGTTSAALMRDADLPSKVGAIGSYKGYILFGNITDVDGQPYPYRIKPLVLGPADVRQSALTGIMDMKRGQTIQGFREHAQTLLIFQNKSITQAILSGGGGFVTTAFNYDPLSDTIGSVGDPSIVTTDRGTFFIALGGLYHIPPGPPTPPRYIGKPIETFWSECNQSRLQYACGVDMPERNGVLFCVPWGSTQTNNNRGIFINTEEWHVDPEIPSETYPAFSIIKGNDDMPFAFNSLAKVTISGRERVLGGGYDGLVYLLDDGTQDVDQGIGWRFKTGADDAGNRSRNKIWDDVVLDVDVSTMTIVSGNAILSNGRVAPGLSGRGGSSGSTLDLNFILDSSAILSADTLAEIIIPLRGESRYIQLDLSGSEDRNAFAMHGRRLRGKPGRV